MLSKKISAFVKELRFLQVLFGKTRLVNRGIIALSICNGIFNFGILSLISAKISGAEKIINMIYAPYIFIFLVCVSFLMSKLFQLYLVKLTSEIHYGYELNIYQKLRNTSYQEFQKINHDIVYTAFLDIKCLVTIPELTLKTINASVIIITCLIYLFMVNFIAGLIVSAMMIILFINYALKNRKSEEALNSYRSMQNEQMRFIKDLLDGFREIYMSEKRKEIIHDDYLRKTSHSMSAARELAENNYLSNDLLGRYSWYILIGLILFALPSLRGFSLAEVSTFTITILYLMGSVSTLVSVIPGYTYAKVAAERLKKFEDLLDSYVDETQKICASAELVRVSSIRFENVCFHYTDENGNVTFSFGPLDLEIKGGSVVFITGGNGSGKSTFLHILTGLFKPESGRILLNDEIVTDANRHRYRQNISAIFTNPYLFSENYDGYDLSPEKSPMKDFLEQMKLTREIRYSVETGKININMSKGQQKRLAMINALLEGRPVLVVDEWAAEQDPHFRKYFYRTLLPELRALGKTIIVITHDDAYFDAADTIIRFDFGNLAEKESSNDKTREYMN